MEQDEKQAMILFIIISFIIIVLATIIVKQEKKQERQQIETQTYIDDNQVYYIYLDKLGDVERVEVK